MLEKARQDLERFYPVVEGKPTVAYLWARTVTCKNCRATLPLLKTLWLCRKDNKRYRLEIKPRPEKSGADFDIVTEPVVGGNATQHQAYDRKVGQGTMSRSGTWCPVCGSPGTVAMTLEDIRAEGMAGHLDAQITAVVVEDPKGKEYRLPRPEELEAAEEAAAHVDEVFKQVPFGLLTEPTPTKSQYSGIYTYGIRYSLLASLWRWAPSSSTPELPGRPCAPRATHQNGQKR